MWEQLLQWDQETFIYLNGLGSEQFDPFWSTVTQITTWIPLFLMFVILFFLKFPRQIAFSRIMTVVGLTLFITLMTHWIKVWVKRPRPCNVETLKPFIRILDWPLDYSFFSGHASSSCAITVLVFLLLKEKVKWTWIFFLWPILFTISRIYVGVHYPLDILVGALIGLLSGTLFYRLYLAIAPGTR